MDSSRTSGSLLRIKHSCVKNWFCNVVYLYNKNSYCNGFWLFCGNFFLIFNPVSPNFITSALNPICTCELNKLPPDPRQNKWEPYTNFTWMVTQHHNTDTTWHPRRTRWGSPWPGGRTGVKQSALGAQSPGHEWVEPQEVPQELKRGVGVAPGA